MTVNQWVWALWQGRKLFREAIALFPCLTLCGEQANQTRA